MPRRRRIRLILTATRPAFADLGPEDVRLKTAPAKSALIRLIRVIRVPSVSFFHECSYAL